MHLLGVPKVSSGSHFFLLLWKPLGYNVGCNQTEYSAPISIIPDELLMVVCRSCPMHTRPPRLQKLAVR